MYLLINIISSLDEILFNLFDAATPGVTADDIEHINPDASFS